MRIIIAFLFLLEVVVGFGQGAVPMVDRNRPSGGGTLDTIIMAIGQSNHDVEQNDGGTVFTSSSDLEMTWDGENQYIGLGFTGDAGLTQGITIVEAWVQFTSDHTAGTTDGVTLLVYGEDEDNPTLPFATGSNNVTNRTKTTAFLSWLPPAWTNNDRTADQRTIEGSNDLTDVIQEIVDRGGYSAGNNIVIIIENDDPTNTEDRRADSFDGAASSTDYPELFIVVSN